MRINILTYLTFLIGLSLQSQDYNPCSTMENMEKRRQNNPNLKSIEEIDHLINHLPPANANERADYVIPVVFHVIHQNGPENISKAQIEDQIRTINLDFSGMNEDAAETPAPFAAVAGAPNIEFRLANIDPNGNCTDGIVHVESPLTFQATDDVKAISYWPSDDYLNVWVVASIESDAGGVTLGYAQFPGWGDPLTDGLVIRYDCIGSIEEAETPVTGSSYLGRVMTHEVGHWLGLRHIWGDDNCGNDWIDDTPPAADKNSGCPSFPHDANACSGTGANGEMFMNYMDYSHGSCQSLFTQGQSSRMVSVMENIRYNLSSPGNLAATGTDDLDYDICAPVAGFNYDAMFLCAGDSIEFNDLSWNGTPDNYDWTFEGGTPDVSDEMNPVITYNDPGVYDVSLNVSNGVGSDSKSMTDIIYISSLQAEYTQAQYTEDFEDESTLGGWIINNDEDNGWELNNSVSSSFGSSSFYIQNRSGNADGSIDELITPSVDMTMIGGSPKLYFDLAYAMMGNVSEDRLKIYVSTDCGETWGLRFNKTGSNLASTANTTANFVPTDSQWEEHFVNLSPFVDEPNVRLKFQFESSAGNNIYIDNLNISNQNSVAQFAPIQVEVYPNPAKNQFVIQGSDIKNGQVSVMNAYGQLVYSGTIQDNHQLVVQGISDWGSGVYFVQIFTENAKGTAKLLVE